MEFRKADIGNFFVSEAQAASAWRRIAGNVAYIYTKAVGRGSLSGCATPLRRCAG